jgi:hypothetical protein
MSDKRTEVIVKCRDNCSCLSVDRFEDEPNDYYITTYKSYSGKSFKERLKDIWKIILGHSVVDVDIILTEEDFDKIRKFK